ncbi:MAG: hypothetical protein IT366_12325 [Candidatus Hydrogenedentes bacterium]|nr:hypothetical protein [Candidatus Hydrogenedentota bacterium]
MCKLRIGESQELVGATIEIPVTVEVCNTGNVDAGLFRVALRYLTPGLGPFTLTFTVPHQASAEYAMTDGPLAVGETVIFKGVAVFPANMSGSLVGILAEVDPWMSGEPEYAMVEEINEDNNETGHVTITLR